MNKSLKEQVVYEILSSLTKRDYLEEVRNLIQSDAKKNLPEQLKNFEDYLAIKYVHINGARCMQVAVRNNQYEISAELNERILSLHDQHVAQKEKFSEIELQLTALLKPCVSIKAAKKVLPEELHKFLPTEPVSGNTSTAIVSKNLINELNNIGFKS